MHNTFSRRNTRSKTTLEEVVLSELKPAEDPAEADETPERMRKTSTSQKLTEARRMYRNKCIKNTSGTRTKANAELVAF